MKKTVWIFLIALATLGIVAGCKKMLDRKPLTGDLDDLKSGKLESLVYVMYGHMAWDWGLNLSWVTLNSVRDDDAEKGSSQSDGANEETQYDHYNYSKDDWPNNSSWNDHYATITAANNVLATAKQLNEINPLNATNPATLRNIGEACFFRAFLYFDLVKAYGEVPLINFVVIKPADAIQPKASIIAIYKQIDSDLNIASQYLPTNASSYSPNGEGFEGRLTKGAANTLWAQTHLFRSNWSQVSALCRQVIASGEYSLLADFTDLWKCGPNGAGDNTRESIWEAQTRVGQNAGSNNAVDYGSMWQTSQSVRGESVSPDWNLGWGWNTPSQHLVDDWDAADPRKNQTILYSGLYDGGPAQGGYGLTLPPYDPNGTAGLPRKYWNKKVYGDPAMRSFTGKATKNDDWLGHRILRYADVLLMLAEAANEMGDGMTAETNVELVRARARGSNVAALPHIAFVNQAQMRLAIKNERRWEFSMEGYRFYDLVRWTPATTDNVDAPQILGPLGYQLKNSLMPLPGSAIDISGGVLKQNPNY